MTVKKMSPETFAEEIRIYNSIVLEDVRATENDFKKLSRCLSRLLEMGEALPKDFTHCEYEPELRDRKPIEEKISKRFSDFGFYSIADPRQELVGKGEALMVGDSIDDLVDIYCDLNEALLYFENGFPNNLFWHAKTMFGHWGAHAIELKRYLHNRIHQW